MNHMRNRISLVYSYLLIFPSFTEVISRAVIPYPAPQRPQGRITWSRSRILTLFFLLIFTFYIAKFLLRIPGMCLLSWVSTPIRSVRGAVLFFYFFFSLSLDASSWSWLPALFRFPESRSVFRTRPWQAWRLRRCRSLDLFCCSLFLWRCNSSI